MEILNSTINSKLITIAIKHEDWVLRSTGVKRCYYEFCNIIVEQWDWIERDSIQTLKQRTDQWDDNVESDCSAGMAIFFWSIWRFKIKELPSVTYPPALA
jgi:hypothetical protein